MCVIMKKCNKCGNRTTYRDVLANVELCAKCHSSDIIEGTTPTLDKLHDPKEKTIRIVIQRSRADTYKYGYRFRARSTGGYDYSFSELKRLASIGHNFEFIFDDNIPQEQIDYAIGKYVKIGLDIINSDAKPEYKFTKEQLGNAFKGGKDINNFYQILGI